MHIHHIIIDQDGIHSEGLRTPDSELAARWERDAPANARASGHIKTPLLLHIDPLHGDEHGYELITSVHRIHVEHKRLADGTIEVSGIHHYPEKDADDITGPHPLHPLLSKRQAVKVPLPCARNWRVIDWEKLK